jgi:hypothetical protein
MSRVIDHGASVARRYDIVRSSKWPHVERAHLEKQPHCVACREPMKHVRVEVHHIFPFHFCVALGRPDLELDERNLMTLCTDDRGGNHHLLVGHFDDYESMNLHARSEAEHMFHGLTGAQILANIEWRHRAPKRPRHLAAMNEAMRREFRALMDATFPPR